MKTFLFAFLLCLVSLAEAQSGTVDVNLAWNATTTPPAQFTGYICRERFGATAPYTYGPILFMVSNAALTGKVTNVASGTHTYIVRAINGVFESVDSNSVSPVIGVAPLPPSGVIFTVIVNP